MRVLQSKAIALIACVILIVFASLAVWGVVVFVAQRLRAHTVKETSIKAIYLAQAGLNYSLYQYRQRGVVFSGRVNLDASDYAVVKTTIGGGGASSAVIVNAVKSFLGNNNTQLQGVTVGNFSSSPITIKKMIVTWTLNNRAMLSIQIRGLTVWSGRATSSPAAVNIISTTIPANNAYPINIRFNNSMRNTIITLQFVMSDGTITSPCTVYPAQGSLCSQSQTLSIKSMGKTTRSGIYRTVQAVYNVSTGDVNSCSEINATVP